VRDFARATFCGAFSRHRISKFLPCSVEERSGPTSPSFIELLKGKPSMPNIQLFLQFEGSRGIELIEVDSDAPGREILVAAVRAGFAEQHLDVAQVFGPDDETPLNLEISIREQGIHHKHRVHVHRCRKIEVTLHFNDLTKVKHFPPSATIDHVKKWFVHAIDMSPVDATEHVLQLFGSSDRPEPDTQIGMLVSGCCELGFNLVPIKRVEG
jgi:hypothetical protein